MKVEVEETCTDKQNSNACLQHSLSIEESKYRFNLAVEKNPNHSNPSWESYH